MFFSSLMQRVKQPPNLPRQIQGLLAIVDNSRCNLFLLYSIINIVYLLDRTRSVFGEVFIKLKNLLKKIFVQKTFNNLLN